MLAGSSVEQVQSLAESDALLAAEVPFIGRELCAQLYEPAPLPEGTVCTAHQRGGAGAGACVVSTVMT